METVATREITNAEELAKFILETLATLPKEEQINYVEDIDGLAVRGARFVRRTLSDDSKVVELVLDFYPKD